jgi:hypothetical protein
MKVLDALHRLTHLTTPNQSIPRADGHCARWGCPSAALPQPTHLSSCPPARVSLLMSPRDRASEASRSHGEQRAEGPRASGRERSPEAQKANPEGVELSQAATASSSVDGRYAELGCRSAAKAPIDPSKRLTSAESLGLAAPQDSASVVVSVHSRAHSGGRPRGSRMAPGLQNSQEQNPEGVVAHPPTPNHPRASRLVRPRVALAALLASCLASLAFTVTPALAATPPEAPMTEAVSGITSTEAVFHATLDPNAAAEELIVEYGFFFAPAPSGCTESRFLPEPAGQALGATNEPVSTTATGLEPNRSYIVCAAVRNLLEEAWPAIGRAESFKTLAAPPTVTGPAAAPRGGEARVEALVNPDNELTECHLEYGTATIAEHEQACEPEVLKGFGEQGVGATLGGLESNTTYKFEFVAANEQSRKEGAPASGEGEFTTKIPPEAPEALEPSAVTGTTATLEGVLNPGAAGEPGSYVFVYRQNPSECEGKGQQATAGGSSGGEASEHVPGEPVTGLLANTTYTYCVKATNGAAETATSPPRSFTTPAEEPTVTAESFTNVGSSSAVLHATVEPGGTPTGVFFEYGPTSSYTSETPLESAGGGSTPVSVQAMIENLAPDATYHFRAVTTSAGHTTGVGTDTTFNTLAAVIPALPDDRGYELASPVENGDSSVVPGRPGVRAATDGHALAYLSTTPPNGGVGHGEPPPAEIGQGSQTNSGDNQYLAEHSASGWAAVNIQPPGVAGRERTTLPGLPAYAWFSQDLSEGIIESSEPLTPAAPGSGYLSLYSRSTATGAETPLYTRTPPSHTGSPRGFEAAFAGASIDGSHQLFEANDTLLEDTSPVADELNALATEKPVHPLYDRTGGNLIAVDVLPDGRIALQAAYGAPPTVEGGFVTGRHGLDRMISAGGARIFWTDTSTEVSSENPSGVTRLFVRENDASPSASTTEIDASEVPVGTGATETKEREERSGAGIFMTASADGSKVYFIDDRKLTADSVAAPNEPDLYMYNFEAPEGQRLTDLTTTVQNLGEHAHVVGVLGASEDGSYVYFAAAGALASGAKPQECIEETRTTYCNVYVLHSGESSHFVAAVTYVDGEGGDSVQGEGAVPTSLFDETISGDWVPAVGDRTAVVSPDGRHLVFESVADLNKFDGINFDGGGSREIYLYDFGGGLSCVSCNPSGAPALTAELYARHFELPESFESTYALRDMSSDGNRIFFNSKEALVSGDDNNRTDVYEWEAPGEGTCVPGGPSYSGAEHGCLYLLSGGTSAEYSAFLDADETGENVFFATRAQLTPQDHGETFAVYDARVGAPAPSATTACTGSGCQGVAPVAPRFSTPPSSTFSGGNEDFETASRPTTGKATNPCTLTTGSPSSKCTKAQNLRKALTQCHKDKKKAKKKTCEASARKKYGPKPKKSSKKTHRKGD